MTAADREAIPITGASLAFQVRGMREAERRPIVLVEGHTDSLLYSRFFAHRSTYRMVNCLGKTNLIDAMNRLAPHNLEGVLAICDADWDRITGTQLPSRVLATDHHDAEVMCWVAGMAEDCIEEALVQNGLLGQVDAGEVASQAVEIAATIGRGRLANHVNHWRLNFKAVEPGDFVLKNKSFDWASYVTAILEKSEATTVDNSAFSAALNADLLHDTNDLINGHDLADLVDSFIAIPAEVERLGGPAIESMLRLAMHPDRFEATMLLHEIRRWEAETGMELLSDRLAG